MNDLSFLKIDQAEWYEKTWLWQLPGFFAWDEREDISSETPYPHMIIHFLTFSRTEFISNIIRII